MYINHTSPSHSSALTSVEYSSLRTHVLQSGCHHLRIPPVLQPVKNQSPCRKTKRAKYLL